MPVPAVILLYEIGEDMALKVVYLNQRPVKGNRQSLCERSPYKQGPEQPRPSRKGYGRYVGWTDAGPVYGLAYDRYDVQLVRPGCQFGDHASVCLVDILACKHVRQQIPVPDDGCRSVIAR